MELIIYKLVRPIIKSLFYILYHPTIVGTINIPKKGRVILAGNHTNNFDCLLLISSTSRVIHFLGKHTLFKGPKKIIMKAMGVIPVDRTKKRNHQALSTAINYLNDDKVIGIFPEGTINRTKEVIMPFKMGAVKMAYETGSIIIPFTITGKYKLFKNDLKLVFGKPLKARSENLEENNEKLMNTISDMLKENE